jgi:hypothetical protein
MSARRKLLLGNYDDCFPSSHCNGIMNTVRNEFFQMGLCGIDIDACHKDCFFFSTRKMFCPFTHSNPFNVFTGKTKVARECLHCVSK